MLQDGVNTYLTLNCDTDFDWHVASCEVFLKCRYVQKTDKVEKFLPNFFSNCKNEAKILQLKKELFFLRIILFQTKCREKARNFCLIIVFH